jgi:cell division protein FtsA
VVNSISVCRIQYLDTEVYNTILYKRTWGSLSTTTDIRFSLDIGTRNVIGLVTVATDDGIKILACERMEHNSRAMLDGQIHDIPEVAQAISDIKQRLEVSCGPLTSAAVAAAGRSLCTVTTSFVQPTGVIGYLQADDVRRLEIAAVQTAQQQLAQQNLVNNSTAYYCVGYSVIAYTLDDIPITNLEGQRGKSVGVEIIATFLPRVVIESLQSALAAAQLDVQSLTLEPIAAINVLIPTTMRHLNLALVDIGAGTSDVAITANGSVIGYGMVPCAGDEITEAISHRYLLDFNEAEKAKCRLHESTVTFTNVLGLSYTIASTEIIESLRGEIHNLAETISQQILTLNGRVPQAVLLIGGGSLTPGLRQAIGGLLSLPDERIGIREAHSVEGFLQLPDILRGPDGITPLGITKTAHNQTLTFLHVTVNGTLLRLFNFGTITVSEALLTAGLNIRQLHGRPGMALSVSVNGKPQFLPGTLGLPPEILLNGQPATFDTPLSNHDILVISKGSDGQNASGTIVDVLPKLNPLSLTWNGQDITIAPQLLVSGQPIDMNTPLVDGMQITIMFPQAIRDIARHLNDDLLSTSQFPTYYYQVNGEVRSYKPDYTMTRNSEPASLETPVTNGDVIVTILPPQLSPVLGDVLQLDNASDRNLTITVNGQPKTIYLEKISLTQNKQPASLTTPLENGATITYEHVSQPAPIVSELLLLYEAELLQSNRGSLFKLTINGQVASYVAPLKNGDQVELIWDKQNKHESA